MSAALWSGGGELLNITAAVQYQGTACVTLGKYSSFGSRWALCPFCIAPDEIWVVAAGGQDLGAEFSKRRGDKNPSRCWFDTQRAEGQTKSRDARAHTHARTTWAVCWPL